MIGKSFRCDTWNCLSSGFCGVGEATPSHLRTWVYLIVGIGIFGGEWESLQDMERPHVAFASRHVRHTDRSIHPSSKTT